MRFNKPPIVPKAKTKPLHWNRLVLPQAGERKASVWDNVREVSFDENEAIELFGIKKRQKDPSLTGAPTRAAGGGGEGGAGGEGSAAALTPAVSPDGTPLPEGAAVRPSGKPVRVLPSKRYNAIAIMRSRLPSDAQLKDIINRMDRTVIDKHMIHELYTNLLTQEEEQMIRDVMMPGIVLDKSEHFGMMLASIPFVRQKLHCWDWLNDFEEKLSEIGPPLLVLQKACKEVRESGALRGFLGIVLAVGNFLNAGNATRGQADGFNLETLSIISDIRDAANKGTVFDLCAKYVTGSLAEELEHVGEAASVDLKFIQSSFVKLASELDAVKADGAQVLEATSPNDSFRAVWPGFLATAEKQIGNLKSELQGTLQTFLETVDWFTTNRDKSLTYTTDAFFGIFKTLVANAKKAAPKPRATGKAYGARVGTGEDPMADLIAKIKAGKARRLNLADAQAAASDAPAS